jgi:peroxiredoxin-like protein
MDLAFQVTADWSGVGPEGQGTMRIGSEAYVYSAPASMGGKGVGASPEDYLLAAVTACYSGTLMRLLTQKQLPVHSLTIRTEGVVEGFPNAARFARITVHPTVVGGIPAREADYQQMAEAARDQCFIGKTVREYLRYTVGTVVVEANA